MTGFYAGSFDPFTNGHLIIAKKAAKCFDKLIIGIGANNGKLSGANKDEMKKAMEETMAEEGLTNVTVIVYDNLTVEKARELGADILVRGLRNGTDYQYEENISEVNERISGLDTCYFRAGELRISIIKCSYGAA
ncbi:MAG: pantetheine-phosphate adenylyltransferase [Firmicutes bacterium]|nr:pantetheine-phosphate adenylyltransferase [Bacillota bacterium]